MATIHTVRVHPRNANPQGAATLQKIQRGFGINSVTAVEQVTVYRFEGLGESDVQKLATQVLIDPVSETGTINELVNRGATHVFEVAYRPGVMNPVAGTLRKVTEDLGLVGLQAAATATE